MEYIHQMAPWLGDEEKKAVIEYLDTDPWLTEFKKTREFEQMIASYVGSEFAVVVNNGTVSITIALMALGIGQGDEVIVPNYTMIATANAVVLAGGKPVFVDIKMDNLCMNLDQIESAINERTKAVIFVSLNGRSSDMAKLIDICEKHGIFLVEDAAQSLGSKHKGKHLGTFGIVGSFSFSALKVITSGQGGAIITEDERIYERILKIKDFGRSKAGVDFHETMGFNFKFTDLQAIIGIEQMKKLDWRVKRKKEIYALYKKQLSTISQVEFIDTDLNETSPWFIDILVPEPLKLQQYLHENNIGSRPFYPPIHSQPAYKKQGSFPESEYVSEHGLWLPSSSFLNDETINVVCEQIKDFFQSD